METSNRLTNLRGRGDAEEINQRIHMHICITYDHKQWGGESMWQGGNWMEEGNVGEIERDV